MKRLYYTRSNGDILSVPYGKNLSETKKLCPEGASKFQAIDDDAGGIPNNAKWNGSKYINDDLIKKGIYQNKCDELYKSLRKSFYIQESEVYEFDIEALLLFDNQLKNKTSDIKVKEKGSKIKPLTKSKSTAIMTKVNIYLESISDAYNLDWDLVEAGDYSLPNLTAIKEAQDVF